VNLKNMINKLSTTRVGAALFLLSLLVTPQFGSAEPVPEPQSSGQAALSLIKGTVVDDEGEPLIGVTVMSSSKVGVSTDIDGNFTLNVKLPTTLTLTYVGCRPKTVRVDKPTTSLKITMETSSQSLEEVVVVGYGTQKKETLTGSVAAITAETIQQTAAANLTTALAGRLPGLTTLQTSGMPGADDVVMYLRGAATTNGTSPLILIDGVPREDISSIDPNEVQSISILKDASATAVFGVRGANGVILVTTRRGETGKASVSVSANYSLQAFICKPTRIHSWEFAELRNQAYLNDGNDPSNMPYTDYMIQKYRDGSDPIFYPDRDVYNEYFKKWAPQTRVNVNVNGGTDRVKYFLNVGYLGQSGQLRTGDTKAMGYDPSFKNNRFNFRSNLDFNVFSNFKLSLNVASYLGNANSPAVPGAYYTGGDTQMVTHNMVQVWNTTPDQPGPLTVAGYTLSDGTPVEAGYVVQQQGVSGNGSVYGDLNRRGYKHQTDMTLNTSVIMDWGLDFITKGLSTKLQVAFDAKAHGTRQGEREYRVYDVYVAREAGESCYYTDRTGDKNDALSMIKFYYTNYYLNLQYSLNYDRTFGAHNVTGMFLFQRDNWQKYAADLPYNMVGIAARATYGYDGRYLAEVNIGYNGSEQFAKGHRFGFFPAFSAGWIMSNEEFLKDNEFISKLKLRASYGKVGNDNLGSSRFLYLDDMQIVSGSSTVHMPSLGNDQYILINKKGNSNIGWEIAYKQNYGLDFTILGNDLSISLDYFRENRENILISRNTIPELQGLPLSTLPAVNMGKIDNQGFEIDASYYKGISRDFSVTVTGNFGYNRNKVKYIDEVAYDDSEGQYAYKYRTTGFSIGQCWGYLRDYSNGNGFINTQEELDWATSAYQIGKARIGDFLYKDVNGDGVISEKDLSPIGYGTIPRITYGFGANLRYRQIDLSFQFAGVGQVSGYYNSYGTTEQGLKGFYTKQHLTAYTPERYAAGEKIEYPALSYSITASHVANDYFIMDRSFLRLKNLEVGYTLAPSVLRSLRISKIRAYLSGTNLLTLKKMKTNVIDPEQTTYNQYPVTKMWTVGLNVVF
jgi:TonB-linked SusC/RagA family outer membrane protein